MALGVHSTGSLARLFADALDNAPRQPQAAIAATGASPLVVGAFATAPLALGPLAAQVNFLFVTVDPNRDTPAALAQYVALFGPNITGLRGGPNQLYSLARRYRVVFSVTKPSATTPYEVTHSAAIYVFDANGQAQFIIAGLDTTAPDIPGITADLRNVIQHQGPVSWWSWLADLLASN